MLVAEMTVAELLADVMRTQRLSQRALALYMDVSPTAVNDWVRGKGIPDPRYCWKIAELAHLPVEEVMRAAGHLPDSEPMAEPEVPPWLAAVIRELTEPEQETLAETARSLLELRERRAAYEARLAALPTEPAPPQSPQEPPSTE